MIRRDLEGKNVNTFYQPDRDCAAANNNIVVTYLVNLLQHKVFLWVLGLRFKLMRVLPKNSYYKERLC